jgi:hypothetical protein
MQQRRLYFGRWTMRVLFCHGCKVDSESTMVGGGVGGLKLMCLSASSALDPIQKQKTGLMLHSDAAQVCSNVGLGIVDGQLDWGVAKAARQIVSEKW